jgi:hypothetical protein
MYAAIKYLMIPQMLVVAFPLGMLYIIWALIMSPIIDHIDLITK